MSVGHTAAGGMSADFAGTLAILLLALPLAGCLVNALFGRRLGRRFVNVVGPGVVLAAFVVAVVVLVNVIGASEEGKSTTVQLWQFIDLGKGNLQTSVATTFDPLSALMIMVITGVGFLIHVYSVGYMEHDESPHRFFSYMNLFIFSMLLLVLAADFFILVIGWGLVALSSYLLIGYWYQRPSAVAAARKAFITQVIGDVALVIAAFMILTRLRTFSLSLPQIFADAGASFDHGGPYITGICVLLAIAAFAKSAQFPLHTWLPDAMEGPTPVSALIHAATMVTAGVYLIARFHTLFDLAPFAQGVVACVGIGTAFMAGVIALSQIDIKRVIAYSTMSQIGLMIFAVGIGAYSAGMFHFATHAVFKALLFMAAGNVIHALHDEQDIRLMGGLAPRLKITNFCFLVGSFALAGIPIFAGFFSKEELLGFGSVHGPLPPTLWVVGVAINVLTGVYAFRLYFTVFHGEARTARVDAAHEAPRSMLIPVELLTLGSIVVGLVMLPALPGIAGANTIGDFLDPVFKAGGAQLIDEPGRSVAWATLLVGTAASFIGVGLAYRWCYQHRPDAQVVASRLPRPLTQLSLHKFYFDEIYDAMLVRPTRALARSMRRVVEPNVMDGWIRGIAATFRELSLDFRFVQTGIVRDYAALMLGASAVFVVYMVVVLAK
ncbi:MAG TPA: NADH-quinone oxidoreductase subunit L [Candidatus Dormibacteraeota bacterium]|jgi:NADH-quinone oxidoreductase subunit L|nr:NADH-quinone oxidoreductase subunit L [Candidatus Dormibacteraeota bacterium]